MAVTAVFLPGCTLLFQLLKKASDAVGHSSVPRMSIRRGVALLQYGMACSCSQRVASGNLARRQTKMTSLQLASRASP
ncbi:uncharacterized protein B0T23DRAFT_158912 [Neurospora hispaniola]|uniref:Secreted protein n=1 Tax=Neurospora hispaniola TaxID=588809 RepID=A0AAJ0MPZ9_9PEZI|nr:hypothetical protein B0T23DRAFT_158912 [Neurospora hispaniola]